MSDFDSRLLVHAAGLSGAPTGGTSGFEASLPPTITLRTAETNSPRFGLADVTLHDGKDSGQAPAGRWQAKWQSVGGGIFFGRISRACCDLLLCWKL